MCLLQNIYNFSFARNLQSISRPFLHQKAADICMFLMFAVDLLRVRRRWQSANLTVGTFWDKMKVWKFGKLLETLGVIETLGKIKKMLGNLKFKICWESAGRRWGNHLGVVDP